MNSASPQESCPPPSPAYGITESDSFGKGKAYHGTVAHTVGNTLRSGEPRYVEDSLQSDPLVSPSCDSYLSGGKDGSSHTKTDDVLNQPTLMENHTIKQ
ncbi:hypothetical protein P7K49_014385 [Saguinus oedipus]|uniref:Uncharacterized protein n=1 Tax=Saguinus oedipus TaxID=9490 RepID=A0ABQ9VIM8_SAGOE|nr:hypothetical protein P7K49_014385 [Saguinus oedipus]